ncbi:GlxA family transcriptional regulator [Gordonia effusa]|nr:helix-turn-helix domain-containing protein [Gordonia effusa]
MHRVVALAQPIQPTFELDCAFEIFGLPRPDVPQRYDFTICTENPGPIPTSAGYTIHVERGLEALDSADTVIIPGWIPVTAPLPSRIKTSLIDAHARGARIASICSGVFALAQTGLLDGRTATTHPSRIDELHRAFPSIDVVETRYVDHSDVATSAGATTGIDLCLCLVAADFGEEHAGLIAESMAASRSVADKHRSGTIEFDELTEWVDSRLGDRLTISDLAVRLNTSPRTLARRCTLELGMSPGQWLISRRLSAAQTLLRDTDLTVETIAHRAGFGSAVNLRRRFRHHFGVSPNDYRKQAHFDVVKF